MFAARVRPEIPVDEAAPIAIDEIFIKLQVDNYD